MFGKHSFVPVFFKLYESPHCGRCEQRQNRAATPGPDGAHLQPEGRAMAEQSEFKAILHYKFKPRELHEALSHKEKQNKQITTTKISNQTNTKQKT